MNNPTTILWYYKESQDTLHEIQIFQSEESARTFLKNAQYDKEDIFPKIVKDLRVFIENKEGNLIRKGLE
jgi:hypothetical protein